MNTKMYVGNLPFSATDADVRELFSAHGEVTDVHLPMDRESGRPRGFAFVTMDSPAAMAAAIQAINGLVEQHRFMFIIFHHFYKDKSCNLSDITSEEDCSASMSSLTR